MKYSDLITSAKAFYPLKGSHGWNHILDVLEKAKAMAAIKNQKWNREMEAAVLFHDSGLYTDGIDKDEIREGHETRGAKVAGKVLKGLFTPKQLNRIKAAIRLHRASYKGPYTSYLSDLISSADRGAPDPIPKIIRSYTYCRELGATPEEAYAQVAEYLPAKFGNKGYARIPKYYQALYAKKLKAYKNQMNNLTADKVKDIIENQ